MTLPDRPSATSPPAAARLLYGEPDPPGENSLALSPDFASQVSRYYAGQCSEIVKAAGAVVDETAVHGGPWVANNGAAVVQDATVVSFFRPTRF